MKRLLAVLALAMVFAGCAIAHFGQTQNAQTQQDHTRIMGGKVTDSGGHPISGAVVYLKNTKSLVVKTSVTKKDGNYQFSQLSPNVDYEVYAEKDGNKSATKTLSAFDNRKIANISLRINLNK